MNGPTTPGVLLSMDERRQVMATGTTSPEQLARLHAHKPPAPIVAAFGEVEVVIRPATAASTQGTSPQLPRPVG